jgi:hypothetical protein
MNESEREVESFFMSRLRVALAARDFKEAEGLLRRCPSDSITRVFMLDQIRQARADEKV